MKFKFLIHKKEKINRGEYSTLKVISELVLYWSKSNSMKAHCNAYTGLWNILQRCVLVYFSVGKLQNCIQPIFDKKCKLFLFEWSVKLWYELSVYQIIMRYIEFNVLKNMSWLCEVQKINEDKYISWRIFPFFLLKNGRNEYNHLYVHFKKSIEFKKNEIGF